MSKMPKEIWASKNTSNYFKLPSKTGVIPVENYIQRTVSKEDAQKTLENFETWLSDCEFNIMFDDDERITYIDTIRKALEWLV